MKACTVKFVIIMLRDRLCSRSGNLFLPHVLHVSLMYLKKKKKKVSVCFPNSCTRFISQARSIFISTVTIFFFTLITCRHSSGLKDDPSIKIGLHIKVRHFIFSTPFFFFFFSNVVFAGTWSV